MGGKIGNFDKAIASLMGTIVGVGIFGLPYAISRSGFLIGIFWFIVLGSAVLAINLLYGAVVYSTKGDHRLVGFVEKYLGKTAKKLATVSVIFGLYGALLAYIIIGGEFLNSIFTNIFGGTPFIYSIIFFAVIAIFIYIGIKTIARVEVIMVAVLIFIVAVFLMIGLNQVDAKNLTYIHLQNVFIPYGVILFAMGGLSAIPILKDILKNQKKKMKKSIIIGTVVPIAIMLLFSFVIVGVTGISTSEESIKGLSNMLGMRVVILGSLLGLLSVSTSFMVLGVNLKETLIYDYKVNEFVAWVLAVFVPFAIFLSGSRSFINVIGFTGAVMGGINALLVLLIYLSFRKKKKKLPAGYSLKIPNAVVYILMALFFVGLVFEILSLI